jgi:SAM-dependent methyltransferase
MSPLSVADACAVPGSDDVWVDESRSLRGSFDSAASTYQAARPEYPDALFDDLVALAGLRPGARLIEVGCATGKASRPLLERGFSIVCVELGAQLAAEARRDLDGFPFEVHVAPFEHWEGEVKAFDLLYAATAWHWIDPTLRYRKAHSLLRSGGHLAFWSAAHAFPDGVDPFFTEIQEVYDEIGEGHPGDWPPPAPEEVGDARAEIDASGLFGDVSVRRYVWGTHYTADEYIALLNTFSGHIAMEPEKRDYLFREIRRRIGEREDRRIVRHWYAILHVAAARA